MEDIIMDDCDYQYESGDMSADLSTGRWTSEEHNLFLLGLKKYNKQWKSIAELVKTRTVVQIRTHAQKYFQKMDKVKDNKGNRLSSSYDSYQDDDVKSSSRSSSISNNSMESGVEGDSDSERFSNDNGEPYKRARYASVVMSPRSKRQVRSCTLRGAGSTAAAVTTSSTITGKAQHAAMPQIQMRTKRHSLARRAPQVEDDDEEHNNHNHYHLMHVDHDDSVDGDFFHFVEDEGEELDESIINLLDKIDWDATTNGLVMNHYAPPLVTLQSRCPSPFMDSAASVSSSLESYGIAEVFPLLDFSTSAVTAAAGVDLVSPISTTMASSSSSSSSAVHHGHGHDQHFHFNHLHHPVQQAVMMPTTTMPFPALQQERVAFAHVIQEIKHVFGGLQQRRQLEQQFEDEVGSGGDAKDGKDSNVHQPPPLPSIRALIAMTSSKMNVSAAVGRYGALTPSSNTFCHYPLSLVEIPNFGFYSQQNGFAPLAAGSASFLHHQQQQDGDISSLSAAYMTSNSAGSRKRGRPPSIDSSK